MKKLNSRKLAISQMTIRTLTAPQLDQAAGGGTITILTRFSIVPVICAAVPAPRED